MRRVPFPFTPRASRLHPQPPKRGHPAAGRPHVGRLVWIPRRGVDRISRRGVVGIRMSRSRTPVWPGDSCTDHLTTARPSCRPPAKPGRRLRRTTCVCRRPRPPRKVDVHAGQRVAGTDAVLAPTRHVGRERGGLGRVVAQAHPEGRQAVCAPSDRRAGVQVVVHLRARAVVEIDPDRCAGVIGHGRAPCSVDPSSTAWSAASAFHTRRRRSSPARVRASTSRVDRRSFRQRPEDRGGGALEEGVLFARISEAAVHLVEEEGNGIVAVDHLARGEGDGSRSPAADTTASPGPARRPHRPLRRACGATSHGRQRHRRRNREPGWCSAGTGPDACRRRRAHRRAEAGPGRRRRR